MTQPTGPETREADGAEAAVRAAAAPRATAWRRRAGALLLLLLLLWLLRKLAWRELVTQLMAARSGWFAAAVLLQVVVLALWATLWRCFIPPGESVRYRRLLQAVTLSSAAMLVTPSFAGQASAALLLARRCRLRLGSAAAVIAAEQVSEAAAKAMVLLLALALAPLSPAIRSAAGLAALLFGGAAMLALLAGRFWPRLPAALRSGPGLIRGVTIALCIKATEAGMLVAVQRSLGVRLGVGPVLLLLALAAVGIVAGSLLPVPGPVGVGEAAVAFGYTQLGLPLELSVALVAVHSAALLLPRLAGAGGVLLEDALRANAATDATMSPTASSGAAP
jgi:uncharacterized membrane protein YbhN (UPF0104 family)